MKSRDKEPRPVVAGQVSIINGLPAQQAALQTTLHVCRIHIRRIQNGGLLPRNRKIQVGKHTPNRRLLKGGRHDLRYTRPR